MSLGQGAGLVEAEHVDPTQRLDGARVADQRAVPGEASCGGQLGRADQERKSLGHGGHGQVRGGRGGLTQGYAAQQPGTDHRHRRTGGQGDRGTGQVAQPGFDPAGRWCLAGQGEAAAGFGVGAGGHHHGGALSGGDRGAFVEHRSPFGDGCGDHRLVVLADR